VLAHPGIGLGRGASEPFFDRAHRDREEFPGLWPGREGLRDGFTAFYTRAPQLFRDLARLDVLVVDDWGMAPLADAERRGFLEICEDRYQVRSMILTSQLPVAKRHEQIGDPALADSILDRLVHNAHRIEMRGESMRKKRGKEQ
jgi:DNA replication protein DnaC